MKWGPEGPRQGPGAGQAWLHLACVWPAPAPPHAATSPISRLLTQKLRIANPPSTKSSKAPPPSETLIQGTEVSVPAPCHSGEVPPEPSPSTPTPPLRLHDGL